MHDYPFRHDSGNKSVAGESGWVRGDRAIDPKILQQNERLRMENADLRKRLDEIID